MAYLDNTVITVDAVLTKLGRERLSQGQFTITKWAVSDDEVDYSLYNTAHPLGTDYYSNIIESMPILEAIPDESQALRYKLRSGDIPTGENGLLPKLKINGTLDGLEVVTLPAITSPARNSSDAVGESQPIEPTTENGGFEGENYIITLFNENVAKLIPKTETLSGLDSAPAANTQFNTATTTVTAAKNYSTTQVKTLSSGGSFAIQAVKGVTSQTTTKVRITGEDSGATKTLTITINPA